MSNSIEQQRVIDAPESSDVLVIAGAGSGKTYTMTQRIIKLICDDHVPAEKILGLTFTRKAAGELLTRVSNAVSQARRDARKAAGNAGPGDAGNVAGATNPDSAFMKPRVYTYDAFFQSIVRQYGLLIGMDPGTQPLSSAGAVQMISDIIGKNMDSLFTAHYFTGDDGNGDAAGLSPDAGSGQSNASGMSDSADKESDAGSFEALVSDIHSLANECASSMIGADCQTIAEALDRIQRWDDQFLGQLREARAQLLGIALEDVKDPVGAVKKPQPNAMPKTAREVFSGDFEAWLHAVFDEKAWTAAVDEAKSAGLIKRRINLPKCKDSDYANPTQRYYDQVLQYLFYVTKRRNMLIPLARQFDARKREAKLAEFSDFTIAAFQLLTRFPSIGADYCRRFTHVFLDEYQDTSTTQATLLAQIFHPQDVNSTDLMNGASPRKSAVTAVGDPYQAIYAWRGASPGAFRLFREKFGITSDPYSLSVTRRNPKLVLDAANRLTDAFRKQWTPDSNVPHNKREVEVLPLKPLETEESGGAAMEASVAKDMNGADRAADADADPATHAPTEASSGEKAPFLGLAAFETGAEEIAAVVEFAVHAQMYKKVPNPAKPGEFEKRTPVAILFRSTRPMQDVADAISQAGMTYEIIGASGLLQRADVADLKALLEVVADHSNTPALQELLASPRFSIPHSALKKLATMATQKNIDFQYRTLEEAGYVTSDENTTESDRKNAVNRLRDDVMLPTGVFLADLLMDDDFDEQLSLLEVPDDVAFRLHEASLILRRAEKASERSLRDAMRTASAALTLPMDSSLARIVADGEGMPNSTYGAAFDAVMQQVDSYEQELPGSMHPTVRGFFAWMAAQEREPAPPAANLDQTADVQLMTVHQAKGLEWPAVAVMDMRKDTFPSSTGDNLLVVKPGIASWTEKDGPSYTATKRSWLENPTAIPAPVRADADLLPRFPHDGSSISEWNDAAGESDTDDGRSTFPTMAVRIERETLDALRLKNGFGPCGAQDYLSQAEEYGRRGHDEERRLAYVALTRAKNEALLVCSRNAMSAPGTWRWSGLPNTLDTDAGASNFWSELYHAYVPQGREEHPENDYAVAHMSQEGDDADNDADNDAQQDKQLMQILAALFANSSSHSAKGSEDAKGTANGDPRAFTFAPSEEEAEPLVRDEPHEPLTTLDGVPVVQLADAVKSRLDDPSTIIPDGYKVPTGVFIGEGAEQLSRLVVNAAFTSAAQQMADNENEHLPQWPSDLQRSTRAALAMTAEVIDPASGGDLAQDAADARGVIPTSDMRRQADEHAKRIIDTSAKSANANSQSVALLSRARLLVAADAQRHEQAQDVIARANAARKGMNVGTTNLRFIASIAGDSAKTMQVARSILRPVPMPPDSAASAGTRFHEWAQQFIDVATVAKDDLLSGAESTDHGGLADVDSTDSMAITINGKRQAMLDDVDADDSLTNAEKEWRHRLATSPWASRTPYATEAPLTLATPDGPVNGTLDAVFYGGLDSPDAEDRFTIVDWKTGRMPRTTADRDVYLIQLDVYRLLLASQLGVPLDAIDATLYFLSQADPAKRAIHADLKSAQDIEKEIAQGRYLRIDTDA